eukprot:596640-Pleurochrysis_carterae.AAC.1
MTFSLGDVAEVTRLHVSQIGVASDVCQKIHASEITTDVVEAVGEEGRVKVVGGGVFFNDAWELRAESDGGFTLRGVGGTVAISITSAGLVSIPSLVGGGGGGGQSLFLAGSGTPVSSSVLTDFLQVLQSSDGVFANALVSAEALRS